MASSGVGRLLSPRPVGGGCGSRCHDNKRKAGGSVPSALQLKPRKVWMARLPSLVQGEAAGTASRPCLESGWCGVREFEGHRPEGRAEKGAWPPRWKHLGQSPSLTLANGVTLDFVRMLRNSVLIWELEELSPFLTQLLRGFHGHVGLRVHVPVELQEWDCPELVWWRKEG